MSAENKAPALRFKGFSGEWEDSEFLKLVVRVSAISDKHLLPRVEYEDIISGRGLLNKNIHEKESNKTGIHFESGDVLFGKLRPYLRNWLLPNFEGIAVGDFWVLRANESNNKFIYHLIQTAKFEKVANQSSGSKMPRSDWGLVSTALFENPKNEKEQTKIGNYFQQLDTLIAQHQQKHDKLLNLKKALLEKMFPKQGATVPEIRFKGFSGEWEKMQLKDLADIVRGASPRPIEDPKWFDKNSEVGWLRIRDVTEQEGRIHHLEQRISKLGEGKTRVLTECHLLLSIAASVGKPVINYVNTGVHDGFLIFKKSLFDLEYMFQWLKSFEEKWQQYGQPGSQVNLNSDIVKRQEVFMPKPEEQTKIGNLFQQLDTLITQHQTQLKKLNNIKQACLEKMFV